METIITTHCKKIDALELGALPNLENPFYGINPKMQAILSYNPWMGNYNPYFYGHKNQNNFVSLGLQNQTPNWINSLKLGNYSPQEKHNKVKPCSKKVRKNKYTNTGMYSARRQIQNKEMSDDLENFVGEIIDKNEN